MSTTATALRRYLNSFWTFPPASMGSFPQASCPFGLTAPQFCQALVDTKNYIVGGTASGTTGDRSLAAFPFTTLVDKMAFFCSGGIAGFSDNVSDSGGDISITIGGVVYLYQGLFYPQITITVSDASGNSAATNAGPGTVAGTAVFCGVSAPLFQETGSGTGLSANYAPGATF